MWLLPGGFTQVSRAGQVHVSGFGTNATATPGSKAVNGTLRDSTSLKVPFTASEKRLSSDKPDKLS
jgi:hypothetical protein